ncbi:hypothetical protein EZJ49_14485 [Bdellovibrio bacteriovorus]|uniref:hypothetical protein n=1 Tax=Bdellovibrio bacteriovorus TaxID=959 RepID=UPI0021CED962|nr:hypothetical protein [Bdellovibrio bacteriovorus]UXR64272.1 hypothetical protein EZJ49_14485 [Bdellovibrio bacteriovorus]
MIRLVLAISTVWLLSSCTTKNDMSLIFSSENTPTVTLKLNDDKAYTSQTSVPLQITASRESTEMTFSNSAICSGIWEPFSSSRTVTVPNVEGEHFVSVKIRTQDGFSSNCVTAKVVLDKSPPTISDSMSLTNTRSLTTQSPRLLPPVTADTFSGVAKYEIKLIKTAGTTVIKDWAVKDKDALYFDGLTLPDADSDTYYYLIRATDNVGNVSLEKQSPNFIVGPVVTVVGESYNIQQTMGSADIQLSRASSLSTTVYLRAVSGTAIAGLDFLYPDITSQEVVIPAGATTAKTYFSIATYSTPGSNKRFELEIANIINAAPSPSKAAIELLNANPVISGQTASGYKGLTGAKGHMCALRTDNKLDCWGGLRYSNGQSGEVFYATEVAGTANVRTLGIGYSDHNCYIDTVGDLYCFGDNTYKQLGNNAVTPSASPLKIAGYSNVKKVSVGMGFTCFIDSSDKVRCLGKNDEATSGQAVSAPVATPTLYASVTKAIDVATGNRMACAIDDVAGTRTVKCWGKTINDVAGSATATSITDIPNDIISLTVNGSILADVRHACGLTESGDVYCWGSNYRSRRGAASGSVGWTTANKVTLPVKAVKVQAGTDSTCALGEDDSLYCWGAGLPSTSNVNEYLESYIPLKLDNFNENVTDFQLTELVSCAITVSSRIKCWGVNKLGELGNGIAGDAWRTVAFNPAQTFDKYLQVATGVYSTCAIRANKTVTCWGQNDEGQLGNNSRNPISRPHYTLAGLTNVKKIVGRNQHYCALTESGSVYCWGYNLSGQLGNNATAGTPEAARVIVPYQIPVTYPGGISGLPTGIKDITVGFYNSCAVTTAGGVMCWGNNAAGESGHNAGAALSYPQNVTGLATGVENVAIGLSTSCAVRNNTTTKTIHCWGLNNSGILANGLPIGPTSYSYTPQLIDTITTTKAVQVFVGGEGACYIHDGTTKCWGIRTTNAIMPVSSVPAGTPVQTPTAVPELAGASTISFGTFSGCAAMTEGTVKCWGVDNSGFVSSAFQIVTAPTTSYAFSYGLATSLSLGMAPQATDRVHACAVTSLGDLKCWGSSTYGEGHDAFFQNTPSYVLK